LKNQKKEERISTALKIQRWDNEPRERRADCMVKFKSKSMYALVLALSLIFSGVYMWAHSSGREEQDEKLATEYQETLEKFRLENVHYNPGEIVKYILACQNSNGYFVDNPDLINEPMEQNIKTVMTTRYAISTLIELDSIDSIDREAVLDYVMDCYVPNIKLTHSSLGNISYYNSADAKRFAGFGGTPGSSPGVRTTMEALLILEKLDALDEARLNLIRIENFIRAHLNADGGFWDEDYADEGMDSTLKCSSRAIKALGIIYGYLGNNFDAVLASNATTFVESCHDTDGGYADRPGEESTGIYETYDAFTTLWWLGDNNTGKLDFVEQKMSLENIKNYIINNYYRPDTGAFVGYEEEATGNGSLQGTFAAVRLLVDSGQTQILDRLPILLYVMNQEAGPGQFGRDMYSSYAAVEIFTKLDTPIVPMETPQRPERSYFGYPDLLSVCFIIVGAIILYISYYASKRSQEELEKGISEGEKAEEELKMYRDALKDMVEERTAQLTEANVKLQLEISERVRVEEELMEHRSHLEEEIKARTEELSRSNKELEQFAYIASHDLQEPLRMVASYVQLLERRYESKLDKDALEFIAYAVDGATRMKRLINDLLTYSRVGTRKKPFQPTDCSKVVDQTLSDLDMSIKESGAVVTRGPLPTVMADDTQLAQLFLNLIGNAIKFRGKETPTVHISVKEDEEACCFTVRDNGIGIEHQHVDRIFQVFQRLHTKAEYPGTGIGLAVCKKIVERHGGRMWVISKPDEGSTFYFTIPKTKGAIEYER